MKIHVATGTSEDSSSRQVVPSDQQSDSEQQRDIVDKDENRGGLEREHAQLSEILEEDREMEIDNIHSKGTGNFGNSYTHTIDSGVNIYPFSGSHASSTQPNLKGIGTGLVANADSEQAFPKMLKQERLKVNEEVPRQQHPQMATQSAFSL